MSQPFLQKLNYNIIKISSYEDESASISQTLISFENSWVSERFCTFPQQIIIKFEVPVNLRQINIISHEKKISEKISFFSFCPQKDLFIPISKVLNFENIGFINFNPNFASNYQVRELKRVSINIKSLFLKIELDKNYINDYNPYHQVGLINLDFYGFKLSGYNDIMNKNPSTNKKEDEDNNGYNILIDEICGEKIKQLNNKLTESNKNQNYNECLYYKELISKAKEMGNRIYSLQKEKNEAIKIEDYDKAIELKNSIDNIKTQLYNLGEKSPKRNSCNSFSNNDRNNIEENNLNDNINNEIINNLDSQNINNSNNNTKNNSFILSNNNSKSFESYNKRQSSLNSYNNTKSKLLDEEKVNYNKYDDMVLPAIQNRKKQNKTKEEIDLENNEIYKLNVGSLEELDNENNGNYTLLIPFIEEFGLRNLLSKQIYYKSEGMKILKNKLSKIFVSSELNEILPVLFELIANFIEDKNSSIVFKTLDLISQIFQYMDVNSEKINIDKNLYNFINDRIIQKIISFLSDGSEIVRNKAKEVFIQIIYENIISLNLLIYNLLHEDVKNKNNSHYILSPISVELKLFILKNILNNYTKIINNNLLTEDSFPKDLIIDYLIMNLNNLKNNIKDSCREVCILAFELFGAEPFKDKLPLLDKRQFERLFKINKFIPMMRAISTDSLDNNSNEKSKNNSNNNSPIKNKKLKPEYKCSLCKENIGSESLINHKSNCPMYIMCKKCKIYVEVKNLNNHKLSECKYKNEYKLCARCKEAIHINSYNIHNKNQKCNPWNSNYNRCPLCHRDIPLNYKGFFQHLIREGCPKRAQISNSTEEGV